MRRRRSPPRRRRRGPATSTPSIGPPGCGYDVNLASTVGRHRRSLPWNAPAPPTHPLGQRPAEARGPAQPKASPALAAPPVAENKDLSLHVALAAAPAELEWAFKTPERMRGDLEREARAQVASLQPTGRRPPEEDGRVAALLAIGDAPEVLGGQPVDFMVPDGTLLCFMTSFEGAPWVCADCLRVCVFASTRGGCTRPLGSWRSAPCVSLASAAFCAEASPQARPRRCARALPARCAMPGMRAGGSRTGCIVPRRCGRPRWP